MNETPTGTFGQLPIGARFRIPWTYATKTKIAPGPDGANAVADFGGRYRIPDWWDVRRDAYTEMRQAG